MNIIKLAFEIFLLYLLYKLIVDLIIPVYKTTKQVKRQFGEMQNKMNEQMNAYKKQQATAAEKPASQPEPNKEEYIDYEEIK